MQDSSDNVSMTTDPAGSLFNLMAIGLLFLGSVVSTKSKQSIEGEECVKVVLG